MASEKPPWETADATKSEDVEKVEKESPPDWMLGAGLDTDMSSEGGKSGAGSSIRFWMPKGAEKNVVWLTDGDKSPVLFEHQFQMGGRWTNWVTCLEPLGVPCPFCKWALANDGQFRRYKGVFFTIIDTSEFTDKSGKLRKNERRLLVAKKDTAEIIKRRYLSRLEAGEKLRGAKFRIFRANSDKSASVGTDFEFTNMVDLAGYLETAEFDYADLLKPDPEKADALMSRLKSERLAISSSPSDGPEGTGTTVSY